MRTWVAPMALSMTGEVSPVKAPSFFQCMFWAPMKTDLPRAASTSAGSEVMAGQRAISAAGAFLVRGKKLVRKAVDSMGVLYIFQLAAIRGLRMSDLVFHLWRASCSGRCFAQNDD